MNELHPWHVWQLERFDIIWHVRRGIKADPRQRVLAVGLCKILDAVWLPKGLFSIITCFPNSRANSCKGWTFRRSLTGSESSTLAFEKNPKIIYRMMKSTQTFFFPLWSKNMNWCYEIHKSGLLTKNSNQCSGFDPFGCLMRRSDLPKSLKFWAKLCLRNLHRKSHI